MSQPKHFISCDWGTSNFRLRAVLGSDLSVVAEHATEEGVRVLNDRFLQEGTGNRQDFFAQYIREQLQSLPSEFNGAPLVISGMASADIGLRELPYGTLPIAPTAERFQTEDMTLWPGQRMMLVSGIKSETGMMRGEETQALGLLERMQGLPDGYLLLPGTHSKHLRYIAGQFTGFTSFMTGELFEVISRHSILAGSVKPGGLNDQVVNSFSGGVQRGYSDGFSAHLFSIRAGHVLHQADPTDSFYRLSGLLIGEELSHLSKVDNGHIYLAGAAPLLELYQYALEDLGYASRLTVLNSNALSDSLLKGQWRLLQQAS